VANQILPIFGITEPSGLYDRRVKPDGFEPDDFFNVLCDESRFVFGIDWRAALPDELGPIAAALEELGAKILIDVASDANDGFVSFNGKTRAVKYVPTDRDDFADVIAAIQSIIPKSIEFRAAVGNSGNDS